MKCFQSITKLITRLTLVGVACSCGNKQDRIGPPGESLADYPGIDRYVFEVPMALDEKVSADPNKYLPELVDFLIKGASDETAKVKRIHDWIAANILYDYPCYNNGAIDMSKCSDELAASVLRERKAICGGYSDTFAAMAALAGIDATVLIGYTKLDSVYETGKLSSVDHAWNKVKIDGAWRLVDVTWDAGGYHLDDISRAYSTSYFLPDTYLFGLSHHPENDSDQFIGQSTLVTRTKAVSAEEFVATPTYTAEYFARSCTIFDTSNGKSVAIEDNMTVTQNEKFTVSCFGSTSQAVLVKDIASGAYSFLPTQSGATSEFTVPFSTTGSNSLTFYTSADGQSFPVIASFRVRVQ